MSNVNKVISFAAAVRRVRISSNSLPRFCRAVAEFAQRQITRLFLPHFRNSVARLVPSAAQTATILAFRQRSPCFLPAKTAAIFATFAFPHYSSLVTHNSQ
jgi:hypothetical protein